MALSLFTLEPLISRALMKHIPKDYDVRRPASLAANLVCRWGEVVITYYFSDLRKPLCGSNGKWDFMEIFDFRACLQTASAGRSVFFI